MAQTLTDVIDGIARKGSVAADDVLKLRRHVFGDGVVGMNEADALFRLNEACTDGAPEWQIFFVEALTDFIVNQKMPQGYLEAQDANYLITRISRDGRVDTATELELLVNVIEKAKGCPPSLIDFALSQVRASVLESAGPIRRGLSLKPGVIAEAEVDVLRRVLHGRAGDGNIAITRSEAEFLFDLNDATADAENHPSWADFFVKAIANFLMAGLHYELPTRDEALRTHAWLQSRDGVGGFLGKMFGAAGSGPKAWLDAISNDRRLRQEQDARLTANQAAIASAERITADEAAWVAQRIGRDGVLHNNEKALLAFIRENSPEIHPALKPLIERAA